MLMFTLAILAITLATLAIQFDHFQFPLIHGPIIPGSYAILLFIGSDLLPSPVRSKTGCCFCFGSISSFFLELFLHSSAVANWAPTNLGSSSFNVLSFCLFILFLGFKARIVKWFAIPVSSRLHFVRTLHPLPTHLGWPYRAWLIVSWS